VTKRVCLDNAQCVDNKVVDSLSGSALVLINEVTLRRARLVLG